MFVLRRLQLRQDDIHFVVQLQDLAAERITLRLLEIEHFSPKKAHFAAL